MTERDDQREDIDISRVCRELAEHNGPGSAAAMVWIHDAREDLERLRAEVERLTGDLARRQRTNLELVELSKGLENERDAAREQVAERDRQIADLKAAYGKAFNETCALLGHRDELEALVGALRAGIELRNDERRVAFAAPVTVLCHRCSGAYEACPLCDHHEHECDADDDDMGLHAEDCPLRNAAPIAEARDRRLVEQAKREAFEEAAAKLSKMRARMKGGGEYETLGHAVDAVRALAAKVGADAEALGERGDMSGRSQGSQDSGAPTGDRLHGPEVQRIRREAIEQCAAISRSCCPCDDGGCRCGRGIDVIKMRALAEEAS